MNILDTIIAKKRLEVDERKSGCPVKKLEQSPAFNRNTLSLSAFLQDDQLTGIIAEFKRRSPSKGVINATADVVEVTSAYAENGASALSVLTDEQFFGGSTADLVAARINQVPILRKDFIIDEYQLTEARAMGADVILLIAACLSPQRTYQLAKVANDLGLEVLLELHDEDELQHVSEFTPIVGINNRNLKTFTVDTGRSLALAGKLPTSTIKVAESGIDEIEQIRIFRDHGYRGFLIGEHFMRSPDPGEAFRQFVSSMKKALA